MKWLSKSFFCLFLLLLFLLTLPIKVHLNNVKIPELFEAKELFLDFNPLGLFFGKIVFNNVEVKHATIHFKKKNQEIASLKWPKLPLGIELHHFYMEDVTFGNTCIQNICGSACFEKGSRDFFTHLETEFSDSHLRLLLEGKAVNQNISCCIRHTKAEDNFVYTFQGSLENWSKVLQKNADDGFISGRCSLNLKLKEKYHSLGKALSLHSNFKLNAKRILYIENLEAETQKAILIGSATCQNFNTITESQLKIELKELEGLTPLDIKGKAFLEGSFIGSLEKSIFSFDYFTQDLNCSIWPFVKDLKGSLYFDSENKMGHLTALTQFCDESLMLAADLTIKDSKKIECTHLNIAYLDSYFIGNFKTDLTTFLTEGNLKAKIDDLSTWKNLHNHNINGCLEADFIFSTENQKQNAEAFFKIHHFSHPHLEIADCNGQLSLTDFFGSFSGQLKSSFNAFAKKEVQGELQLSFQKNNQCIDFTIEEFKGLFWQLKLELAQSLKGRFGKDVFALNNCSIDIGNGEGSFFGNFQAENNQWHIQSHFDSIPLSLLRLFQKDMPLEGFFSGDLYCLAKDRDVIGSYSLQVEKLVMIDKPDWPALDITANGNYEKQNFTLSATIAGLADNPVNVKGNIDCPFAFSSLKNPFSKDSPFSLHIKTDSDLEPLFSYLPIPLNLQGHCYIDICLAGSLKDPILNGSIQFKDGSLEMASLGTVLKDIEVEIECEDKELKVLSFKAKDAEKGLINGSGTIILDSKEWAKLCIYFDATQLLFIERPNFIAKANASLELVGSLLNPLLRGKAHLIEGLLFIPDQTSPAVSPIAVTYINEDTVIPLNLDKHKNQLALELEVDIPKNFILEGRGLHSEWKGKLNVGGYLGKVAVEGILDALSGTFTFVKKEFQLESGQIMIKGLDPKEISINLNTDLEVEKCLITANISGAAHSPDVTFFSNPPLNTNEILCWILFNTDISEISPFQALELAHTLMSLSTNYMGPDLLNKVKEAFGLDVLGINSTKDKKQIVFQAGKYITQRLFVGMNKSISGDEDALNLQAKLTKSLTLQAEMGRSATGKLSFKWYHSY